MALTQISTAGVKDDAVTAGKIPANAVGSSELADNAVDTAAITNDAVTYAKMQNTSNGVRLLGKHDSGGGEVGEITAAQARTMLNVADGATNSTSTTINNNADNRVITGSGTANTLNGESGLTFDGTTLTVAGASNATHAIFSGTGGSGARGLEIKTESGGAVDEVVVIKTRASGTTAPIKFQTNGANSLELAGNGGDVIVKGGNLKFGIGGKGIDFSATADEGSGAVNELLDDYEEGTFTATLTGIGGGTNPTFSAQASSAGYVKIGNSVHIYIYIFSINCTNGGSGIITTISGIPFVSGAHYYPGVVTHNTVIGNGNVNGGYVQANNNNPHFIPIAGNSTSGATANTGSPLYIMVAATMLTA